MSEDDFSGGLSHNSSVIFGEVTHVLQVARHTYSDPGEHGGGRKQQQTCRIMSTPLEPKSRHFDRHHVLLRRVQLRPLGRNQFRRYAQFGEQLGKSVLRQLADHLQHFQSGVFTGRMPRSGKLPVLNLLTGQKSGFSPRRGDSLHRFMSNLAGSTDTWVRLAM